MRPHAVVGFLIAVFPVIATPGASFTLLTQRVSTAGRRQSVPVILGTCTGLYAHALLAGVGLSALVMRSSQLFTVVKICGAVYLIALGIWSWRSATRAGAPAETTDAASRRSLPWQGHSAYVQALLGNVLNPKAASIFLTLVPQFIDPQESVMTQMLVLGTALVLLLTVWLLLWTVVIGRAADTLRSPRFRVVLQRITGCVLIALGLRTAVT
ncbi:LysE family translocator [Actinopolymorpha alba]|uniref:LysE family translocator n=1 Tax=Actinopolymorpha alba TaxID=533267 RepID=UPI00036082F0|nr:LysE family translocator [Actinopolymorpha alba]